MWLASADDETYLAARSQTVIAVKQAFDAAGIATGYWAGEQDVIDNWAEAKRWKPAGNEDERARLYRNWKKAVTRTFDWVDDDLASE